MKTRFLLRLAAAIFGIVLIGGVSAVQLQAGTTDSDQLALDVANVQKANLGSIAKYSWRVKSNIALEGESKATSVVEMFFNSEGKLETTNISSESTTKKKRGLRGRRQAKKIEDFSAYLQSVLEHSFKYIFMSKGTLVDVFDRAKITEAKSSIDVNAGDLFVKGDVLFMSLDPATKLVRKLTFTTTLGEDTIQGVVALDMMKDGPSKPETFEFEIPTQKIKITAETFDWIEQK